MYLSGGFSLKFLFVFAFETVFVVYEWRVEGIATILAFSSEIVSSFLFVV